MNDIIAQKLLIYIANNLITESRFLTPNPKTSVEVIGLLDKIAELRDIPKEQNGIEFNQIMDTLKQI
jgi:hypothetical protein